MTIPTDLRREFENKIRRGIFNPVARFLPEEVREDRLQDAVAQTWAMYERYAERGELLEDAILVHSCGLRATDPSRHYVPCNGYQRKRDALDPRNFLEGNVEVLRFGDFDMDDERRGPDEDEAPLGFGLAEATSANPVRKILSAIDLTAWLDELPADDRRMLQLRAAGFTLEETAAKLRVSTSNIFARCKRLGIVLAERAGVGLQAKKREVWTSSRSTSVPISSRVPRQSGMKQAGAR
jgi:hypothetical protein